MADSLYDTITYTREEAGPAQPAALAGRSLRVFALSTCGFCERSMKFLRERGIAFEYVLIDLLNPAVKASLKEELKARFGQAPVFPYLVIDHERVIVGFTEDKWRAGLGI